MIYDLIIIGGGPAGTAAGVYASRKKLRTLLIAGEVGGQSTVSEGIQNWIGTISITGAALAESFRRHLEAYARDTLTLKEGEHVAAIEKKSELFSVRTEEGNAYEAKALLIASGSGRKKLPAEGADALEHKGITYCASCDGPLFEGQDVAVIGGGNAAFETAAQLLAYVKSVTLITHGKFKADPVTIEKVLAHQNMKAMENTDILKVNGDKFVSGLVYQKKGEAQETLAVTGVFVEIGQVPNTSFAKGLVETDEYGRIKIDPRTQKSSMEGIWAAGDASDVLYHQNNIAAGDAVRAVEDIYLHLRA